MRRGRTGLPAGRRRAVGYADYLAAVRNPRREQHEEMPDWRRPFAPDAFDPKKATREMRKIR